MWNKTLIANLMHKQFYGSLLDEGTLSWVGYKEVPLQGFSPKNKRINLWYGKSKFSD